LDKSQQRDFNPRDVSRDSKSGRACWPIKDKAQQRDSNPRDVSRDSKSGREHAGQYRINLSRETLIPEMFIEILNQVESMLVNIGYISAERL